MTVVQNFERVYTPRSMRLTEENSKKYNISLYYQNYSLRTVYTYCERLFITKNNKNKKHLRTITPYGRKLLIFIFIIF